MSHQFEHIILSRRPMIHDHRDFALRDFITPSMRKRAAQITAQDWKVATILDQGNTPHCVGFAWAGFGISVPVVDAWDNAMGDRIYYAAKIIDGEPGQEDGSDTRSGVKAFGQFANLGAYAFATSLDDIITWLLTSGPVITGTDWYNNMFYPDSSGLVHVGGGVAGGHEWMISGVDTIKKLFHCTNSWGTSFGINGQFYLSYADYQLLLNSQGDACTATELAAVPVPVPTPTPAPGCSAAIPFLNDAIAAIKKAEKIIKGK